MIPALIEQAMNIKMKSEKNPSIISDYELAYSCGVFCRLMNIESGEDLKSIREKIISAANNFKPKSVEIERLLLMVKDFEPIGDAKDEEMIKKLIEMGKEHKGS